MQVFLELLHLLLQDQLLQYLRILGVHDYGCLHLTVVITDALSNIDISDHVAFTMNTITKYFSIEKSNILMHPMILL